MSGTQEDTGGAEGSPRHSEADSNEAQQDVVAVSQEGSLGSPSDSEADFQYPRTSASKRSSGGCRPLLTVLSLSNVSFINEARHSCVAS